MITFLQGTLEESWPGRIVVNVNGIGYEVIVPSLGENEFGQMGNQTKVLIHFHVREQEQTLFGFPNDETRDLFRLLIGRVSGVGPKVGDVHSQRDGGVRFQTGGCRRAIIDTISKIKGLGKKTAERVVLELRDKVGVKDAWETQASPNATPLQRARGDAMLGLMALGYKQADARKAVDKVAEDITDTDEVLRVALRFPAIARVHETRGRCPPDSQCIAGGRFVRREGVA